MPQTEPFQIVCAANDVKPDVPAKGSVDGIDVAVFEIDGQYFITQDLCTHGPGYLSEGFVEGNEIECPFHQGRFDIRTGRPTAAPCTVALRIWKATLKDGQICVAAGDGA